MTSSCLVVGAGLSGLMAAYTLQSNGWKVTVVDKGRGVGGRMATRRINGAIFDHGAQFFTVRDPQFAQWVEQWQKIGIVDVWSYGIPTPEKLAPIDGYPRYRGVPSMTAVAKHLASTLQVHTSTKITQLKQTSGWQAISEAGQVFEGEALILTPPVPQSLALLAESAIDLPSDVAITLSNIEYTPCFALMVVLDRPSLIPPPGALHIQSEPIAWIADNRQKGVSPDQTAITIHAGPQFTQQYFDAPSEEVALLLLDAARDWLGSASVKIYQVHRWRYSQPKNPYPSRMLRIDLLYPLIFAGDAFGGPRVEGAALSGLAAAQSLL
ncbi:MAG: NAD/FAD-dependent oxidoreductase [Phototrophicales bacterium]|nr:MAG: NAD/FAD-dependent oxidoreductase [Phototrophicales bacterium]